MITKKSKKQVNKQIPTNSCNQHQLTLKPKNSYCKFNQTITVSFCQKPSIKQKKHKNLNILQKKCTAIECPKFNNDKNYGSPSFILNSEKVYYEQKHEKIKQQHVRKMFDYTDQKLSINIPKPRSKNCFCSVCRQQYQDYLEHIQSQKHKKKIKTSLFNTYILQQMRKFNIKQNNLNLNNSLSIKNVYNSYSQHNISTIDQDQVQIIQREKPCKKIKIDNTEIYNNQNNLNINNINNMQNNFSLYQYYLNSIVPNNNGNNNQQLQMSMLPNLTTTLNNFERQQNNQLQSSIYPPPHVYSTNLNNTNLNSNSNSKAMNNVSNANNVMQMYPYYNGNQNNPNNQSNPNLLFPTFNNPYYPTNIQNSFYSNASTPLTFNYNMNIYMNSLNPYHNNPNNNQLNNIGPNNTLNSFNNPYNYNFKNNQNNQMNNINSTINTNNNNPFLVNFNSFKKLPKPIINNNVDPLECKNLKYTNSIDFIKNNYKIKNNIDQPKNFNDILRNKPLFPKTQDQLLKSKINQPFLFSLQKQRNKVNLNNKNNQYLHQDRDRIQQNKKIDQYIIISSDSQVDERKYIAFNNKNNGKINSIKSVDQIKINKIENTVNDNNNHKNILKTQDINKKQISNICSNNFNNFIKRNMNMNMYKQQLKRNKVINEFITQNNNNIFKNKNEQIIQKQFILPMN